MSSSPPHRLRVSDWSAALILTVTVGWFFSSGFIPTTQSLALWSLAQFSLPESFLPWLRGISFVALCFFFWVSFPQKSKSPKLTKAATLWQISFIPFLIALLFGYTLSPPVPGWSLDNPILWWYLVFVPVGEELLFRGWFYQLVERFWPNRVTTFTNPLPLAVWLSSLAFSLWHIQNLAHVPVAFGLFQITYTFFTGIWLGYVRWQSGSLFLPIVFHALINFLSLVL